MSTCEFMEKLPADVLDYDIDFYRWLPPGDAIVSASAEITGSSVVVDGTVFSTSAAKVWLSGGDPGASETVTVSIVTAGGRSKTTQFIIRVRG